MFRDFLSGVPRAITRSFKGSNLFWHALAVTLTYILVVSGFDWWYFLLTRSQALHPIILVAGLGGFLVPVIVPVGLLIYGTFQKNTHALRAGTVVAQAGIAAWLISSTYKAFTGRIQPEVLLSNSLTDISHNFN